MRLTATARLARALMLMAALALPVLTASASAGAVASAMGGGSAPANAAGHMRDAMPIDRAALSADADHQAMPDMESMDGMPCDDAMAMPASTHAGRTADAGGTIDHHAGARQDADHAGAPCGEGCCPQSSCDMSACVATALLSRGPQLPTVSLPSMPLVDARHATPPSRWPDTPLRPPIG